MSLIRKHVAVLQAWACLALVTIKIGQERLKKWHQKKVRPGKWRISMTPAYQAADCQLVSDEGRRQLRSANSRTCRQTDPQLLQRQMFCGCRTKTVERSSVWDKPALTLDSSSGCQKHFCSGVETEAHCG